MQRGRCYAQGLRVAMEIYVWFIKNALGSFSPDTRSYQRWRRGGGGEYISYMYITICNMTITVLLFSFSFFVPKQSQRTNARGRVWWKFSPDTNICVIFKLWRKICPTASCESQSALSCSAVGESNRRLLSWSWKVTELCEPTGDVMHKYILY